MIIIPKKILLIPVIMLAWIHSPAQISIHDLFGKWAMQTVFVDGAEVSHPYTPDEKRWIEFRSDLTFISDGESYGRREGTYTLDEDSGLLSFNVDLGFGEKSYWHVEFDGEKMIWTDRWNSTSDNIKIYLLPSY